MSGKKYSFIIERQDEQSDLALTKPSSEQVEFEGDLRQNLRTLSSLMFLMREVVNGGSTWILYIFRSHALACKISSDSKITTNDQNIDEEIVEELENLERVLPVLNLLARHHAAAFSELGKQSLQEAHAEVVKSEQYGFLSANTQFEFTVESYVANEQQEEGSNDNFWPLHAFTDSLIEGVLKAKKVLEHLKRKYQSLEWQVFVSKDGAPQNKLCILKSSFGSKSPESRTIALKPSTQEMPAQRTLDLPAADSATDVRYETENHTLDLLEEVVESEVLSFQELTAVRCADSLDLEVTNDPEIAEIVEAVEQAMQEN